LIFVFAGRKNFKPNRYLPRLSQRKAGRMEGGLLVRRFVTYRSECQAFSGLETFRPVLFLRPYVFTLTGSRKRAFAGLLLHASVTETGTLGRQVCKWGKTARTSHAKHFLNSAWPTNYVDCTAFVNGFPDKLAFKREFLPKLGPSAAPPSPDRSRLTVISAAAASYRPLSYHRRLATALPGC